MIEYHKLIKHFDNENRQLFVFRVDRHEDIKAIEMLDLWIVTIHNGYQSKMKIDLNGLGKFIGMNPDTKMSETEITELYDMFDPILDNESRQERDLEKIEQIIEDSIKDETQRLLVAADAALVVHPIPTDFSHVQNNTVNRS